MNLCYKNCETCSDYSTKDNYNCESCASGYYRVVESENVPPTNCYDKYESFLLETNENEKKWVSCLKPNNCKEMRLKECACKICEKGYYLTENSECEKIQNELLYIESFEIKSIVHQNTDINVVQYISIKEPNKIEDIQPYNISIEKPDDFTDQIVINNSIETNEKSITFSYDSSISFKPQKSGFYILKITKIDSTNQNINFDENYPVYIYLIICDENCFCDECNTCTSCIEPFIKDAYIDKCYKECPYFIDEDKYLCYDECINYYIRNKCVDKCPLGYSPDSDNECQMLSANETLSEIKENIVDVANSQFIFECDQSTFQVFYYNNPPSNIPNLSSLNLGECEQILRKQHNIPITETFIILLVDIKNDKSFTNDVQYEVYDEQGKYLDLSNCKLYPPTINYPIVHPEYLNIQLGKEMMEKNIDIYNLKDPFFNDLCYKYNEKEKDITLDDRQINFYQEINLCKNECEYVGIDYNEMRIHCKCQPITNIDLDKSDLNSEISYNEIDKMIKNSLFINYKIFKCYEQILEFKNLRYNIGFYFGLFIITIQFILFLVFLKSGFASVYSKLHKTSQNNKEERKKSSMIKKRNNFGSSENSTKRILNLRKKTQINYIPTIRNKNFLETLNYKEAIKEDNRNFMKMYFQNFLENWDLSRAFYLISIFELRNINIIVFLSYLLITFTTNSLLFNEDDISKRYNNNLKLLDNLLKSLYSYLIGGTLFKILKYCTLYHPKFDLIVIEVKDEIRFFQHIMKIFKTVRIKLYFFFIINFFVIIMCWVYITIFCFIYMKTQFEWWKRCWTSFLISLLINAGICFLFVTIRFLGLRFKNKKMYNFGMFIRSKF